MDMNQTQVSQMQDQDEEIDLLELFHVLLQKAGILILSGLIVGCLAILGTKLLITPQYQSVTKMYVLNKQENSMLSFTDLQTSSQLTKDYAEIIKSRKVTEGVIAELGLDLTYKQLLEKITVETASDNRILTIKVMDEDPYMARSIANELRVIAAEHIKNVTNSEAVNVVDEADVPAIQYSPNAMKNGVLGALLGGVLAAAVVILQYMLNDTICVADDVERYLNLSVLGTIPLAKTKEKNNKKTKKKIKKARR
ncbi:MAG: YveK family protein [Lachnospiraceae bacterium]